MIDERLELRLRLDPTGDPVHVVGGYRRRFVPGVPGRARERRSMLLRPIGAVVAVVALLVAMLIVRPNLNQPAATPVPTPTPSPLPTFVSSELDAMVDAWMGTFGPANHPAVSATIVGPDGRTASHTVGIPTPDPGAAATGRIGEVGWVHVAVAAALVHSCVIDQSIPRCPPLRVGTSFSLDDPVRRWYGDWPAADSTTVRQLFEGTSGVAAVGATIADVAAQIAATPGADWSRRAVLRRAIQAPRRFAAGTQRAPVDTESMLLDEILVTATGLQPGDLFRGDVFPPAATRLASETPVGLLPGHLAIGDPAPDLDPMVLNVLGASGGMTASSQDLAELAVEAWGTSSSLHPGLVAVLADSSRGHLAPPGAQGLCPCPNDSFHDLISQTGRAPGWTAVIAYSYEQQTGIGLVVARTWRDQDIGSLVHELMTLNPNP